MQHREEHRIGARQAFLARLEPAAQRPLVREPELARDREAAVVAGLDLHVDAREPQSSIPTRVSTAVSSVASPCRSSPRG